MAIERKPKPPPPKKLAWTSYPCGDDICITCYPSAADSCYVTGLMESSAISSFHDAELARATVEINSILSKTEEKNEDATRRLSFISIKGRLFLVWTQCEETVGPDDDLETIKRTLHTKD